MSTGQALLDALESDRDNQIKLLQSFVRAPSANPPGNTEPTAKVLTEYLSSKSIPFEIIEPQAGKPNIVSEFSGGKGDGPRVVLNGHIDVFPVGDGADKWSRDPLSGDLINGRIHGRGVVDMKSGTASLVIAFAHLYERRESLRGSVALCAVSDEETGGRWGTKYLIQQDAQRWGGDVMLSAEPTGQTVRFSEKGTLRLTGQVSTPGALGAYLNLSQGAIRTASAFLNEVIETIEATSLDIPEDIARHLRDPKVLEAVDRAMGKGTSTIIARPTVNIGVIKGGTKVNMIPDGCTFELDIRLPIGLTAEEVLASIDSIVPHYPDAKIKIEVQEAASNPSSFSTIDHPMIDKLQSSAERVEEFRPVVVPSMGATDCKHYRYAAIPAYVYGCSPFSMGDIDESASVDEFVKVTQVHALAAWEYLQ